MSIRDLRSNLSSGGHAPSLVAALAYFDVSFMVWVLLGALGPFVASDLHLTPAQKGLMVAVPALGGSAFRLLLGSTVDRIGLKRAGLLGLGCTLIPLTWAAVAGGTYAQVLGIGVLLGIAGGSFAVALPLASRWYPPEQQGLVLGIAGAGNSGTIVAALAAPRIAEQVGWHATFAIAILPVALVWGLFAVLAKEPPRAHTTGPRRTSLGMLVERDARWLCVFYLVTFGGFVGLTGYLPIFYVDRFGLTPVSGAAYAALCAAAGSLLRPVGGALADRRGGTVVLAWALSAIAVLAGLLATRPGLAPTVVLLFFLVGGFGVGNGAVFQLVGRRYPADVGPVTGLVGAAGGVGGFVLVAGFGWLAGATGSDASGYLFLGAIAATAALAARNRQRSWRPAATSPSSSPSPATSPATSPAPRSRQGPFGGGGGLMAARERPNIPRAKREGLELDLAAVCAAGPEALSADDHYRLKTYGVCPQRQDDRFMVRLRVAAGTLDHAQASAIAAAAHEFAGGWVHLTTRQNVELHSVALQDVPALYEQLAPAGVVGRSSCGHTIRNVLACPEAATSAEEPFDVSIDARWLSSQLVARSAELNVALPNRLNISLGGCTQCGLEALTNDIGLVACVQDGEPGYQLWAGGSLGTAPRLSLMLRPFLPRADLWPAVWSIVEWFVTEGDTEQVTKGRLKFLVEARGESAFRAAFTKRFAAMRADNTLVPPPVDVVPADAPVRILGQAPALGWRHTIRPERRAGYASITVRVPLGDLRADDLVALTQIAPDGRVVLTRDQNVLVPSVPVDDVSRVVGELGARDLGPEGALGAADVRACPGLSFCSLAITGSQPVAMAIERAMNVRQDLPRDVVISVSGCPNSCTKQQVADIGLSGTKVKVAGMVGLGYQLWLGADLPGGAIGEPVLRLTEDEVPAAVIATTELWVALRRPGETPGSTFRRTGLDVVADALEVRLREFGFGERPLLDDALVGAA